MRRMFVSFALATLACSAAAQTGSGSVAGIQLYPGGLRNGVEASKNSNERASARVLGERAQ